LEGLPAVVAVGRWRDPLIWGPLPGKVIKGWLSVLLVHGIFIEDPPRRAEPLSAKRNITKLNTKQIVIPFRCTAEVGE